MRLMLIFLFLLLPYGVLAEEQDLMPDYRRIAALVFPETTNWIALDAMKRVNENWLKANRSRLQQDYSSSKASKSYLEGDSCSFIGRLFDKEYANEVRFFTHDIDSDGRMDVIYSGSALCAEGNATVIWFGTPSGYELRSDYPWDTLLLSIQEGKAFRISSLQVGCCGDQIDKYYLGSQENFRYLGSRRMTRDTVLPGRSATKRAFKNRTEMVLRASPHIDDMYDVNASGLKDEAVFGNVLARYLPGCSGYVIGDSPGIVAGWSFVVLDDKCGPLRTNAPYWVNVGWVEMSQITLSN